MVVPQLVTTSRFRNRILTPALALTAAAALVSLAGCTGGTASSKTTGAPSNGSGRTINAVMIVGADGDPFFSKVKRGSDDVVAGYGGKLKITYVGPKNYDNLGPDVAKLLLTALSQKPDIVLAPDWVPASEDASFQQLKDAGIPVALYNAGGQDAVNKVGAITYIGNEEITAGKAAGKAMLDGNAKNVVCVNTIPGSANIEDRCKGAKQVLEAGGAKLTELSLPSTTFGNPTAISEAVKATLVKDPTIDGLLSIGAVDSDSAYLAMQGAGVTGKVKLGCFDLNSNVAKRIQAGEQFFAVDQQPYLQGFLAASTAYQYANWGLLSPEAPNLTGPLVITKATATAALQGIADGVR
jgi:simple sugar transport system substrate-binding protein